MTSKIQVLKTRYLLHNQLSAQEEVGVEQTKGKEQLGKVSREMGVIYRPTCMNSLCIVEDPPPKGSNHPYH